MKGTEIISAIATLIPPLLLMPLAADSITPTGVSFQTSDTDLQRLFDAAEAKAAANIVQFTPTMKALVEGGGYGNVWIETQTMGGEMYAKRNLEVTANEQPTPVPARSAPPMAGCPAWSFPATPPSSLDKDKNPPEGFVWLPEYGVATDFGILQGYCFPDPAWRMYFWANKDRNYLRKLYRPWKPTTLTSGARAIPTATGCWKHGASGTRAKTTAHGSSHATRRCACHLTFHPWANGCQTRSRRRTFGATGSSTTTTGSRRPRASR